MTVSDVKGEAVTERFAGFLSGIQLTEIPRKALDIVALDLMDAAGLCVAARRETYMRQIIESCDHGGRCTAIGHPNSLGPADAALANGVAIHGEDFDDTLEGAPIRVGAMVIPAVLAISEQLELSGGRALLGMLAGLEAVCRLNHVAPGHIHRAGFHPVGVIGALGAAVGSGVAMGLDKDRLTAAIGVAASMSSGILEYLADGTWTKRLHPGWAAQSGLRAARLAGTGFFAPRTALEGKHGFFNAFAPGAVPDYSHVTDGLGDDWYMTRIAFKPYACGTMIHPYIDCARRLAVCVPDPGSIAEIECDTGEGLVHRLWEPLADKQRPSSGYAAKFSMPFCMALGYFEDDAGLKQFSDAKAQLPRYRELAAKIRYRIDPENEYPVNYSGHMRVTLGSGEVIVLDQPHMRGGAREPLTRDELAAKFCSNARHGGWTDESTARLRAFCEGLETASDLKALSEFQL